MKPTDITLPADWLMEHLIISAMRYDASRSSYIIGDLTDIATLIHRNRDKFNPDRVAWLVRDLRETASSRLKWLKNVYVDNEFNDRIVYDPYTLIGRHLAEHPELRFCGHDWEVDCVSGSVQLTPRETPLMTRGSSEYVQTLYDCDLATIVTTANILDATCHRLVTTEHQGRREQTLCFPAIEADQRLDDKGRPTGDYTYRRAWRVVASPQLYVCEKYITDITKPE